MIRSRNITRGRVPPTGLGDLGWGIKFVDYFIRRKLNPIAFKPVKKDPISRHFHVYEKADKLAHNPKVVKYVSIIAAVIVTCFGHPELAGAIMTAGDVYANRLKQLDAEKKQKVLDKANEAVLAEIAKLTPEQKAYIQAQIAQYGMDALNHPDVKEILAGAMTAAGNSIDNSLSALGAVPAAQDPAVLAQVQANIEASRQAGMSTGFVDTVKKYAPEIGISVAAGLIIYFLTRSGNNGSNNNVPK